MTNDYRLSTKGASLLVIVGPTASGKSNLAMKIARQYRGEIICADSRTIYKGMDIGTAKPSLADQKAIPHHLLDIAEPGEFFSAAQFKDRTLRSISSIQKRGRLPILVGGSGLYTDAVLFDFEFLPQASLAERERLNKLTATELLAQIKKRKITPPLNYKNKRHLVRTLETGGVRPVQKELRPGTLVIGIDAEIGILRDRISTRTNKMVAAGLEAEVKGLMNKYKQKPGAIDAIGYREWQGYFDGKQSLQETKQLIVRASVLYARRQRTWFKRGAHINWFTSPNKAFLYISNSFKNT